VPDETVRVHHHDCGIRGVESMTVGTRFRFDFR